MSARFTKEQAEKLTIIENRVKLRPTKSEIVQRLELERLQEKALAKLPQKRNVGNPTTAKQAKKAENSIAVFGNSAGQKRSKYGNKKTVVGVKTFDSKKEALRYVQLKEMENKGEINDLQLQIKFPIHYSGVKICSYIADFTYLNSNGVFCCEDVKGFKTAIYKLKKKLMAAFYRIEITEI